jgi:hypothetical protein
MKKDPGVQGPSSVRSASAVLLRCSTCLQSNLREFESVSGATHPFRIVVESTDPLVAAMTSESSYALSACAFPGAARVVVVHMHATLPLQCIPKPCTAEVAAAILFIEQLLPILFRHAVLDVVRICLRPASRVLTVPFRIRSPTLSGVLACVLPLRFGGTPVQPLRAVVPLAGAAFRAATPESALLEGRMPLAGAARLALGRRMATTSAAGSTLLTIDHALILQDQARVSSVTKGERVLLPWLGVMADWIQGRPSTLSMNRTVVWSFWKR